MNALILSLMLAGQTVTSTATLSAEDIELAQYLDVLEDLQMLEQLEILKMLPLLEDEE